MPQRVGSELQKTPLKKAERHVKANVGSGRNIFALLFRKAGYLDVSL